MRTLFYLPIITLILHLSSGFSKEAMKRSKEECTDVDVTTKMPSALKEHFQNPVDQDSIGWCYGFVAADLMSVELNTPVSGLHASLLYNNYARSNSLYKLGHSIANLIDNDNFDAVYETGQVDTAIEQAIKNGHICSKKDLPYDFTLPRQVYYFIQELEQAQAEENREYGIERLCSAFLGSPYHDLRDRLNIYDLYNLLVTTNVDKVLKELSEIQCASAPVATTGLKLPRDILRPILHPYGDELMDDETETEINDYFLNLNRALDNGKPLGWLHNPGHLSSASEMHVSVVMGRRFKDGKCQYKIRNSWGKSCAAYNDKVLECIKDEGAYWISDETFFDASVLLTTY